MSGPKNVKGSESSSSITPVASDPEFAEAVSADLVDDAAESLRLLADAADESEQATEDITEGIDLREIGATPDSSRATTQKIRTVELETPED